MSFNTKTVKNCQPIEDVGNYFQKLAVDAIGGAASAQIQADALAGVGLFAELQQIGPDYAADPVACQQTVERAFDQAARAVNAALAAKHGTSGLGNTPPPK